MNTMSKMPKGFNWITTLERLSKGDGKTTSSQYNRLVNLAGYWPTCACGQLCRALERGKIDGMPKDARLRMLGMRFSDMVVTKKWCMALEIFHKIEARTDYLLEQRKEHHALAIN